MPYVILNGALTPASEALVPVSDRGFRFGDGVFDTIRVHDGVPYRYEWHMERISRGLAAIKIPFDMARLQPACAMLLRENQHMNGLLRIQITRGSGGSGYLPSGNSATLLIETLPLPSLPDEPIALYLSGYRRIPQTSLPTGPKLCQGLNSTLARMEAAEHGCFEALQLNQQGILSEGSSSNIFWLKSHTLYTPALDCGVLEGSARAALMEISPYPVHEIHADFQTLRNAEGVFICNSAWGVLAVHKLVPEDMEWPHAQNPLMPLLMADMADYSKKNSRLWQNS